MNGFRSTGVDQRSGGFLRAILSIVGVALLAWLALRVIVGIVGFIWWLITTAFVIVLIGGVLWLIFGGARRRGGE